MADVIRQPLARSLVLLLPIVGILLNPAFLPYTYEFNRACVESLLGLASRPKNRLLDGRYYPANVADADILYDPKRLAERLRLTFGTRLLALWLFNRENLTLDAVKDLSGHALHARQFRFDWMNSRWFNDLYFDGARYWSVSNFNTVAYRDTVHATELSFSIAVLLFFWDVEERQLVIAKKKDGEKEWALALNTPGNLAFILFDEKNDAFIGRSASSSLAKLHWYRIIVSYDGSKSQSGIRLFINGLRSDDSTLRGGVYSGMQLGSAPLGNFELSSGIPIGKTKAYVAAISLVRSFLLQEEVELVDEILKGYAEIF